MNRLLLAKARLKTSAGKKVSGARARRTRTLIQIGGLAGKFGLLKEIGITLGQDLQKDRATFASACVLAAIFERAAHDLAHDPKGDKFAALEEIGRELLKEGVAHALRNSVSSDNG